jgi:predicted nucleotide-binding protein
MEKIEQHAGESKYAVVLLTGDDVGGVKDAEPATQQARARQNVILELGWFCGEIGRKSVAVLYEEGVELPSDVDGLAYIPLGGNWQKQLVDELRDAGWDFQLDRLSR